jgi:hypothetical protein
MINAGECCSEEDCEAVDVALEVALEAASDDTVQQHIRRAMQARVAVRDGGSS